MHDMKIPEGWEKKKIAQISDVKGGKRLPKGEELIDSYNGFPYIRVADMYMGGIKIDNIKYVPLGVVESIKNYRITTDDLFISVAGTIGVVGEIPEVLNNANLTENADKITNIKIDKGYLLKYLKSSNIQRVISKEMTTSAQPKLAIERIKKFDIIYPTDKIEQKKIAKIISNIEENIEKSLQVIAKYKQVKKGLMDDLLTGKIRIKNGKWVKETEFKYVEGIGNIPKEWELKSIGDTLKIKHGKNQKEVEDKNGLYPILGSGGNIGFANKYLYSKESVLIGRKGTINKPQFINTPFWTIDTLFYSEIKKQYVAKFIYYKFININWMQYNEASGVPSLSASTIEKIKYSMPKTKEEQNEISNILEKQDQLIEKEEQYLKKLQKLKSGLMDDLLTGRKRVNIE